MYVGSKKTINVKFEPGKIYYLKGYSPDNRTGDYNSKYVVQKDVADDKTEAQYVNVNTKTSESIGTSDDQDWYKFYSDKTQKISLTSIREDLYSADIYIYDEQGKEILSSFLTIGYKSEKNAIIDAENYYIKVYSSYHYTGKYNFRFPFSDVACYLKQVDGGDWYYYVDDKKDTSKTGLFSI